jgi:hypothetical protein
MTVCGVESGTSKGIFTRVEGAIEGSTWTRSSRIAVLTFFAA